MVTNCSLNFRRGTDILTIVFWWRSNPVSNVVRRRHACQADRSEALLREIWGSAVGRCKALFAERERFAIRNES